MSKRERYSCALMASILLAEVSCCFAQIPSVNTTTSVYPANPTSEEQQNYQTCISLLEEAFNSSNARGLDEIVYDQWDRVNPGPYLVCFALAGDNSTFEDDLRVLHPFSVSSTVGETLEKAAQQQDEGSSSEILGHQTSYYKKNRDHCLSSPENETLLADYNYVNQKSSQANGVTTLKDESRYTLVACGQLDTHMDVKGYRTVHPGNQVYCACPYTNIPLSEPRWNTNIPNDGASSSMTALRTEFLLILLPFVLHLLP